MNSQKRPRRYPYWVAGLLLLSCAPHVAQAASPDETLTSAEAQLNAKDPSAALETLGQLVKDAQLTRSQQIRLNYDRTLADLALGKVTDALAELNTTLPDPDAPAADHQDFVANAGSYGEKIYELKGDLLVRNRQYHPLVALYQAAEKDYPKSSEWPYRLAQALLADGQRDEALTQFEQFLADHPDDPHTLDAILGKAETLRQTKRYQEEYDYLLTVPVKKGPEWEIRVGVRRAELLVHYLGQSKRLDLSNEVVEALITKYPQDPVIYLAYVRLSRNYLYDLPAPTQDTVKARTLLQSALAKFPTNPSATPMRLDLAQSYYLEHDYANALTEYQKALDLISEGSSDAVHIGYIRFRVGGCYLSMKRREDASNQWLSLVKDLPEDPWSSLAQKYLALISRAPSEGDAP